MFTVQQQESEFQEYITRLTADSDNQDSRYSVAIFQALAERRPAALDLARRLLQEDNIRNSNERARSDRPPNYNGLDIRVDSPFERLRSSSRCSFNRIRNRLNSASSSILPSIHEALMNSTSSASINQQVNNNNNNTISTTRLNQSSSNNLIELNTIHTTNQTQETSSNTSDQASMISTETIVNVPIRPTVSEISTVLPDYETDSKSSN
jgi:hypothetical protein